MLHKLFVYGTLRKYGSANFLLNRARLLKQNVVLHGLKLFDQGSYPIALDQFDGQSQIAGDLYELEEELLLKLDQYEGEEYYRIKISAHQSWIYLGKNREQVKQLKSIPDGDWLKYLK